MILVFDGRILLLDRNSGRVGVVVVRCSQEEPAHAGDKHDGQGNKHPLEDAVATGLGAFDVRVVGQGCASS